MSVWDEAENELTASELWLQAEDEIRGGGLEELGKGIVSSTIGVAKQVAVQGLIDVIKAPGEYLAFVAPELAASKEERDRLVAPLETAKRRMTIAQAEFEKTHTGPGAWAGRAIGEAIPYMGSALVGGYIVGPIGAAMVGFGVEGGEAYDRAIKAGVPEDKAQIERAVVGSINAAIEAIQIGRLMKFQQTGKLSMQGLVSLAKQKSYGKMATEGVKFGGRILKNSLEEGLEEFLQEGVSFAVPANLRDDMPRRPDGSPDILAIGLRLLEATLGGVVVGGILGGAGAVGLSTDVNVKVAELATNLTPEQRNEIVSGKMDQIIEDDPKLTPQEKLSAKYVLGRIRYNIEQELIPRLNTMDVKIVDNETLAKVGEDIKQALGIDDNIEWNLGKKKTVKRTRGWHRKLGDKKNQIQVNRNHWSFMGPNAQMEMRRTIIHELGHIAAPPTRVPILKSFPKTAKVKHGPEGGIGILYKDILHRIPDAKTDEEAKQLFVDRYGTKRSVHHKAFKKWLKDNITVLEPAVRETLKPVTEAHLVQEAEMVEGLAEKIIRLPGQRQAKSSVAYVNAKEGTQNPWVRNPNKVPDFNRMLLIQFASDLLTTEEDTLARSYYDKLHDVRKGYAIPGDFWEIPQWMGEIANSVPNSDIYIVRNMEEAKAFLGQTDYGSIAFSALDINKDKIKELAKSFNGHVHVGGYVAKDTFKDINNIRYYDSVEQFARKLERDEVYEHDGIKYKPGVNYKHFRGTQTQPRLCLSKGCAYKCAMCVVPKGVKEIPDSLIDKQIAAFDNLHAPLVYLDDKTFGQAKNHKKLPKLFKKIKDKHPEFEGFIIQTTANDFNKLDNEFIAEAGIRYVEIGVESFNDPILKKLHKPARQRTINQAAAKAREAGVDLIANVMIGLPGETKETYQNTLNWINSNSDIISHLNIYNLALYEDTELSKELGLVDINENKVEKAYHKNPKLHRDFADKVYTLGEDLLDLPSKTDIRMSEPAAPMTEREEMPERKKRSRKELLALGHKIPREFGLTDDERRNWIEDLTGKRSLKDLSTPELASLIEIMEEVMGTQEIGPEDFQKPIMVAGEVTTAAKIMSGAAQDVQNLPERKKIPKHVTKKFARSREKVRWKRLKEFLWGKENTPIYHLANILGPTFSDVYDKNIQASLVTQAGHLRSVYNALLQARQEEGITDSDLARMSHALNPRMQSLQTLQEMRGRGTEMHNVEINGRQYEVTMADLIDIYLINNQEDGLRHTMGGGLVINGVETGALDEGTITMLNMLVENDQQAKFMIDVILDIGENIWKPSINNISQRIEGKDIAVVEDWWGLEVYRPKRLGGKQEQFNLNLIENRGIFKDRTRSEMPLVVRDAFSRFAVFENGIAEYVGFAESTRLARMLLNNVDLSNALDQKGYSDIRENIMTIMERAQSLPKQQGAFGKFMSEQLPGLYRAYLYFNPRVIVSQYTSVMNYGAFVSPKYMSNLKEGLNPNAIKETLELSDIAFDRFYMAHSNLALGEVAKSDSVLRLFTHKAADINKIGITLRVADMAALSTGMKIAQAEYKDAQEGNIDGESAIWWADKDVSAEEGSQQWKNAVTKRAEFLWQRSQPSWDKWNRSMTTSGLVRQVFFPFRTFHEKSLTILHEANLEYQRSNKGPGDRARQAKKYGAVLSSYALNTILRALIMGLLTRRAKKPLQYLSDLLESPMSMFPMIGTIVKNSIGNFINVLIGEKVEFHGAAIEAFPAAMLNLIAQAPADFSIAAGYYLEGETDKANTAFKRALQKLYKGIGTSEGIPVTEMNRVYKGWIEGEEEAEPTGRRKRRVRPRKIRARRSR